MSGQWSLENLDIESTSCFPRILTRQASPDLLGLREAVNQLRPDEIKIVAAYVENVLKTRPIKIA
jgi:hypothetical protein